MRAIHPIQRGMVERDCAVRYLHSWALALRGRGWSEKQLTDKLFALANDIAAGAHIADPDGTGKDQP